MSQDNVTSTLEKIHTAAKQEFLEKGFQLASLRNIVKIAGVTTGAFYGYYKSKEELFEALVGEQAEYVLRLFDTTLKDFNKLSGEEQTNKMTDISGDAMFRMLDYIYDYIDALMHELNLRIRTIYQEDCFRYYFLHSIIYTTIPKMHPLKLHHSIAFLRFQIRLDLREKE